MWVEFMVTKKRKSQTQIRIERVVLTIAALAFTLVPVYMLGDAGVKYARTTIRSIDSSISSGDLAKQKVSSDDVELFSEPVVSITFDDGWENIATDAAPILAKYKIASTQYIITDRIAQPDYMDVTQLKALKTAGHEIGSHSSSHSKLDDESDRSVNEQLSVSKKALMQLGVTDKDNVNFAYPYGAYNDETNTAALEHFSSLRNSDGSPRDGIDHRDVNTKERFGRAYVIGYGIDKDTKLEDVRIALDYAREHNGWLVLIFHQINDKNDEYSTSHQDFEAILTMIQEQKIKTATVGKALASLEKN